MPSSKKSGADSTLQQTLLKAKSNAKAAEDATAASPAPDANETEIKAVRRLIEKMSAEQTKLLEDQTKNFAEIREQLSETQKSVSSFEEKLADMLTRVNDTEARLDALEEVERQRCDSPSATVKDIEKLNAKLAEFEDRERRLNLRIYGFPEKVENQDAISFLRKILPEILGSEFEDGLEMERAHRSLAPLKSGDPPRPFVVRFLRFQEKERVRRLAREIGEVHWQNHKISFYQDFSKITQMRRQSFVEAKRLLHKAKIPFGIGYPAVLFFTSPDGTKLRFEDPKKALQCIKNL